ncbi:MAG: hypothetical protein V4668_02745, partial [Patescibacteria group bacterium]
GNIMKGLLTLTIAMGLVGSMTATANANGEMCTKIENICNGGSCRTLVYGNVTGGIVYTSDLWLEVSR